MYSKFRKIHIRIPLILLLTVLIAFSNGMVCNTEVNATTIKQDNVYRIVALGDSITAGYEPGYTEHSIPYGFVERVYEQALFHGLHATYANYGIIGLKSAGLNRLIEAASTGNKVQPNDIQKGLQDPRAAKLLSNTLDINKSIKSADLILVVIGGNDLFTILNQIESDVPIEELNTLLLNLLNNYENQLESALLTIVKLQPNVQIAIADQYLPVPSPFKVGALTIPLYPGSDRQFLMSAAVQLHNRLEGIVSKMNKDGYHLNMVGVNDLFLNNELNYTHIAEKDPHPTQQGYLVMGRTFAKSIWGDYRKVRNRPQNIPISVVVSGEELPASSPPPMIRNDRTFVPMRDITKAIGAKLDWNNATQTATVTYDGHRLEFTIGASTMRIDGVTVNLKSPPAYLQTMNKKDTVTYIPLATLSEALGLQVVYRNTLQTVFINK